MKDAAQSYLLGIHRVIVFNGTFGDDGYSIHRGRENVNQPCKTNVIQLSVITRKIQT